MISISFYLFPGPFCKNAIETCRSRTNLQGVILCISSLPDIQVIKPFALIERCHCRPHEWSKSYHDEFHLNYFYRDCEFLFLSLEYEDVGCYKDKQDRAIETLEGKDSILDGEYNSRANPIAKCAVAAMRKGYSMFAIQNGGWCAASSTTQQTFNKYGKSTNCMADGEGEPWADNAYILRGTFLRRIIRLMQLVRNLTDNSLSDVFKL